MSRWAYARRRDMHAPSVGRGEHRQPRADLATSPTGLRVGFEGAKQPISRVVLRWEAAYGKDYSI